MSKHNVKTASLGFPRIGQNRELKTALEKYWAGKIPQHEPDTVAKEIRQFGWNAQKNFDFIPPKVNFHTLITHKLE